jgi:hypothetical protein
MCAVCFCRARRVSRPCCASRHARARFDLLFVARCLGAAALVDLVRLLHRHEQVLEERKLMSGQL